MRHFFSPRPVAPCPFGMRALSPAAGLITRAGRLLASSPDKSAAIAGTVNLASVAAAANQRLGAAFRADEKPCRRGLIATGQLNTAWTVAVVGVILTPHACPARCEGTAPNGTARLRSAPCLFLMTDSLLPCHARDVRQSGPHAAPSNRRNAAHIPTSLVVPPNREIAE